MEVQNEIKDIELYTLRTLKTPSVGRTLARWIVGIFLVFLITLFLPWQQNIRGTGQVTAFSPSNRPQTVESTIAGRIASWHVQEGTFVEKGDTILTIGEVKDKYFDPDLLQRLEEQIASKEQSIQAKKQKVAALSNQIQALEDALVIKLEQARNKLKQARYKLISDSVNFEAEKVRFNNFKNQYERNTRLYEAGNIALTKYQEIESKFQESNMKVVAAENKFLESQTELINARVNIAGVRAEYSDKISKAESDKNATLSEQYEAEADISKMRNEYVNVQVRKDQYQIVAPQTGVVVKALQAGIGETIKEGEAVSTILPRSSDIAVEMYVDAMDVPLISKGRNVRIQFDGWPSLQFSGWPSVSVGTFGGEVTVIDYVNSAQGKFRLLITPDPAEEPWPDQLRLGSGTKGWVMLDSVPVWYEIWRQLNGFPPSLYEKPGEESVGKGNADTVKTLKKAVK